ncbi:MAG TPA: RodZ domain-containing protein [Streptosporangiaceae bacterium]|nr:RodZ domain-containing protein [Streptosporangiaceae bacterium]
MSIGDTLADARRQAGLTITQVSQRTCIRETIIRGIERGDFSACGGDFYARGHIRSIARAVGADDEELIREYDAQHGAPQAIRAADVFEPATPIKIKERRRPNWSLAMILVLAVVAGYGIYRVASSSSPHSANAASTHVDGSVSAHHRSRPHHAAARPSASPSSTPSANVVISLTAIQDCWVEFTRPDGRFLTQAYIVGGGSKTWTFYHAVNMDIGNPGGIVLTVNGKKLGSPGSAGQPVTLSLGPGKPVTG